MTGATGFVAGHIVKKLPAKGYTVHGTVHEETVKDTAADLVKWGHV